MNAFAPEVFIIGAQKSGTTTLAKLLSGNSSVCVSEPKEPNFYTNAYSRGYEWYRTTFRDHEKIRIDASTTYTMAPLSQRALELKPSRQMQSGVPGRIYDDNPKAKFIYIIRDPVARMYSSYWHNVKYGREKRSFEEAVSYDPQYVHVSEYFAQMNMYLEHFPKEAFLLLKFEELLENQSVTLNACEKFIGVTETKVDNIIRENKGNQYSRVGRYLLRSPVMMRVDRFLPKLIRTVVKRLVSQEIPSLDPLTASGLRPLFLEDQASLERDFGVSYLRSWQDTATPKACDEGRQVQV